MGEHRLIAGAIAIGAAWIAAGVYVGRTDDAPVPPVAPRAAWSGPPAPVSAAPAPVPSAPPLDPDEALKARATAEAVRGLEARKPALVKQCWEPALEKQPDPPRAPFFVGLSIDALGKVTDMVMIMPRVGSRTDVWSCLRVTPLELSFTPPGKPLYVNVPLNFP